MTYRSSSPKIENIRKPKLYKPKGSEDLKDVCSGHEASNIKLGIFWSSSFCCCCFFLRSFVFLIHLNTPISMQNDYQTNRWDSLHHQKGCLLAAWVRVLLDRGAWLSGSLKEHWKWAGKEHIWSWVLTFVLFSGSAHKIVWKCKTSKHSEAKWKLVRINPLSTTPCRIVQTPILYIVNHKRHDTS